MPLCKVWLRMAELHVMQQYTGYVPANMAFDFYAQQTANTSDYDNAILHRNSKTTQQPKRLGLESFLLVAWAQNDLLTDQTKNQPLTTLLGLRSFHLALPIGHFFLLGGQISLIVEVALCPH